MSGIAILIACAVSTIVLAFVCSYLFFSGLMLHGESKIRNVAVISGTVIGLLLYFAVGLPIALRSNSGALMPSDVLQISAQLEGYILSLGFAFVACVIGALVPAVTADARRNK